MYQKMTIILIFSVFVVITIGSFLYWDIPDTSVIGENVNYEDKRCQVICEWGRLAAFPEQAEDLIIKTNGSMFSREVCGSFLATPEIINEWKSKSPGLLDAKIEVLNDGKVHYLIQPGGGAQFAEVMIDYAMKLVTFKVYWS